MHRRRLEGAGPRRFPGPEKKTAAATGRSRRPWDPGTRCPRSVIPAGEARIVRRLGERRRKYEGYSKRASEATGCAEASLPVGETLLRARRARAHDHRTGEGLRFRRFDRERVTV